MTKTDDKTFRCVDVTTDTDIEPVLVSVPKTEIENLADLIREKHPTWNITVESLHGGQKLTLFQHGEYVCDAISHYYSYGGREGLIEWWNCKKKVDPVGWLSAEEALELFEKSLKDF